MKSSGTLRKATLAERQGFEPWEPFRGSTVFETVPFDHSGIAPHGVVAARII